MFARAVLLTMVAGWVTSVEAETFAAATGKDRLTLTCEGRAVVNTPCRLRMGSSGSIEVQFASQPTRYAHLLKRGMEKVLEDKQHKLRPSESDIPLLRALALDDCHPATESSGMSGDLLQLCVPDGTTSVVLFMRGLCDRCDFEPVVLRNQAAP